MSKEQLFSQNLFSQHNTLIFYKQPGCLALTRKFCPKVKQLAKQPLRVKSETKFPKLTNSLSF